MNFEANKIVDSNSAKIVEFKLDGGILASWYFERSSGLGRLSWSQGSFVVLEGAKKFAEFFGKVLEWVKNEGGTTDGR
jgi:hypothetical protein